MSQLRHTKETEKRIKSPQMTQSAISQRLKIIIERLSLDTRSFSHALNVSEGTTRNYFNRGSKPNAEYLEKISESFEAVNLHWLLTGKGEPFLPFATENSTNSAQNQKFFRSPVIGNNQGTANQQQHINNSDELSEIKNKLALSEKEVEHLKAQLESKDTVIAAKDETIMLLRATYTRPN